MKYLRTKDGVFRIKATPHSNAMYSGSQAYRIYDHVEMVDRDIFEKDIIKQADTIEELCDTFVDETENNLLDKFFFYEENGDCFINEHDLTLIYDRDSVGARLLKGAIFTDKGLIYVAKMNDKGELELL